MIRFQAPQIPAAREVERYFALAEESRWYSNRGPCHQLLVARLERYLGPELSCIPVANATLGLMVVLRAMMGLAPSRRQVLMPSFTFAATIDAVLWAGLQPVFVDVEPDSWHLDPAALASALDSRRGEVGAVLAASTFGTPPSVAHHTAWRQAAARAGVPLLVDSAAGFGATDERGVRLGRQGDAEVFSFHATKPFAIGEGGLVTITDAALARRVHRLTNFGLDDGVVSDDVGLNAKLAEWPAATALAVLDGYDRVLAARRAGAERILAALEPHGYVRQAGAGAAAWQFVPVLAPSPGVRAAVLSAAARDGIELRTYFSVPLHTMPAFRSMPIAGDLRHTEHLADRVLSLPMANDLAEDDVEVILACLVAAARRGLRCAGSPRLRAGTSETPAGRARYRQRTVVPMQKLPTKLVGPVLLGPAVHGDERGFFLEFYRESEFAELGLTAEFVQGNHSRSRGGIVRGMHFQPGQTKLVRCARGAIFDVLVDIRPGSSQFGQWEGFQLDDVEHHQLFVPDGFAHGFCVLSELADVTYMVSSYYAPELEAGFAFDDPAVAIDWPDASGLTASARDRDAPSLAELTPSLPFSGANA